MNNKLNLSYFVTNMLYSIANIRNIFCILNVLSVFLPEIFCIWCIFIYLKPMKSLSFLDHHEHCLFINCIYMVLLNDAHLYTPSPKHIKSPSFWSTVKILLPLDCNFSMKWLLSSNYWRGAVNNLMLKGHVSVPIISCSS